VAVRRIAVPVEHAAIGHCQFQYLRNACREGASGESVCTLKDDCYNEFDPEFVVYSRQDAQVYLHLPCDIR
jgi:hypothetical protein